MQPKNRWAPYSEQFTTTTSTTSTSTTTTSTTSGSVIPSGVQQNISPDNLRSMGFEKYLSVDFSRPRIGSDLVNVPIQNTKVFVGCYKKGEVNNSV